MNITEDLGCNFLMKETSLKCVMCLGHFLHPNIHSLCEQPCEVWGVSSPVSHAVPCPMSPLSHTVDHVWLLTAVAQFIALHEDEGTVGCRGQLPLSASLPWHWPWSLALCSYLGRWSAWCRGCWASAGPPPAPCGGSPPPPALLQLAPDNQSSGSLNTW